MNRNKKIGILKIDDNSIIFDESITCNLENNKSPKFAEFDGSEYLDDQGFIKNMDLYNYNLLISSKSKVILVGHACSGKDYAKEILVNSGMSREVSYTTRPMREGEIPGVTYHYVTEEIFNKMIENNEFLQWELFPNNFRYGTSRTEFEKKNVFIMTPIVLPLIPKELLDKCFILYFNIDENTRRKRLDKRGDILGTEKRLETDREIIFKNDFQKDLEINDPFFKIMVMP